jgi:hypothetical protein
MSENSSPIIEAINEIKALGKEVLLSKTTKGDIYSFGDDRYKVEITFEPKWIGLNFGLKGSRIFLSINTDLYDITQSNYQQFSSEIQDDIVDFLHNLKNNKIKLAYRNKKPLMLVPQKKGYLLLKQGMLFSSSSIVKDLQKIEASADFQTFNFNKG